MDGELNLASDTSVAGSSDAPLAKIRCGANTLKDLVELAPAQAKDVAAAVVPQLLTWLVRGGQHPEGPGG